MNGKDLQQWRREHNLSVKHISDALGISHRTVETWESTGRIPKRKLARLEDLMHTEIVALRIPRDLFLRLEARAKAKGYANADAYASELIDKLT